MEATAFCCGFLLFRGQSRYDRAGEELRFSPAFCVKVEFMTFEEAKKQMEDCAHNATPMPLYRCHKDVWALKIAEIHREEFPPTTAEHQMGGAIVTPGAIIVPAEAGYAAFRVDGEYLRKHNPQVGGYFVVYKDGYQSFSPAAAFEEGYSIWA